MHRVCSQGAASQEGTVNRGDFLLSVNGASLAGLAHGDVLKILHQAQLHRDVLVVIKRGNDQPGSSSRQDANGKSSFSRKTSPLEPLKILNNCLTASLHVLRRKPFHVYIFLGL